MFLAKKKIILASNSPRRRNFLTELGIKFSLLDDFMVEQQGFKEDFKQSNNPDLQKNSMGVLAKDDQEDRPLGQELPLQYVQRMAIKKNCDALGHLGVSLQNSNAQEILLNPAELIQVPWHDVVYKYSVEFHSESLNAICISADTIVALGNEILGKPLDETKALEMLTKLSGRSHEVLTSVSLFDFQNASLYCFTDRAKVHFAPWPLEVLQSYVKTEDPMDKAGAYGIQGIGIFLSDHIDGSWDTVAGLPIAKLLKLLFLCDAIQVQNKSLN